MQPTPIKVKVVPDSNVFIAAALSRSYCHDWLFRASEPQANYELFTSEAILTEIQDKLLHKFKFERAAAVRYLTELERVVTKVRPSTTVTVARDHKDNMILECAIEASAELVITFDKDLLVLKQHEGVQIAHPRMVQYWFWSKRS